MKQLFRRELRRLFPYWIGGVLLLVLGGTAVFFLEGWVVDVDHLVANLALILVPGILGVAVVAPDTSSGAIAFLARQPLSSARVLVTKLGAAGVWVLAWTPLLLLYTAVYDGPRQSQVMLFLPFCFASGFLASVMASRVMPALLIAPAIGVSAILVALALPILLLGMVPPGDGFVWSVFIGLEVAFLGVGFLAYTRGNRHLPSPRPALLAMGGLAPILILGICTTAAAHAWTIDAVVPTLSVTYGAAESDDALAVQLQDRCWTGQEMRVALLDRETAEAWVLPARGVAYPAFSPDGERMLVRNGGAPGGWLVHVAERRLEPLPGGSPYFGFVHPHLIWQDGEPVVLQIKQSSIAAFAPRSNRHALFDLTGDGFAPVYLGVDPANRILVWYPSENGVQAISMPRVAGLTGPASQRIKVQRQTVLRLPEGVPYNGAALSPGGRYLLFRSQDQRLSPEVFDLSDGRRIRLSGLGFTDKTERFGVRTSFDSYGHLEPVASFGPFTYGFSPSERHLVVERIGGNVVLVCLEMGTQRLYQPPVRSRFGLLAVWSPDGRIVTLPSGFAIDVEKDEPKPNLSRVVGYLTADLTVPAYEPLMLASWEGGPVLYPLAAKGGAR